MRMRADVARLDERAIGLVAHALDEHRRGERTPRAYDPQVAAGRALGMRERPAQAGLGAEQPGEGGRSEAFPNGEVQPPVAVPRAVGEVCADRADRRAKARADAVAGGDVGAHARIPGVAGVDERGDAPVIANPARVLDAADDKAPAADDGARLLDTDALEGVAAHGLVAAGAEKEGARDAFARRRAHRPRLPSQ